VKIPTTRGERASASSNGATDFSFSTAVPYADKDEYLSKNLVFTINKIDFQEGAGFEGTDRWTITVSPDDGRPDEIITLHANPKRDDQLKSAKEHISAHGPIRNVRLTRSGKAYYFDTVVGAKAT
jgi:hypothetical protein